MPSLPSALKLTASVTGRHLTGQLVNSSTGIYNLSAVTQATSEMHFASLDYLQLMTEFINGHPFTVVSCLAAFSELFLGEPGRVGLSVDNAVGLIPVSEAKTYLPQSLLAYSRDGSGIITHAPDQPTGVILTFDDFLIGVKSDGSIELITSTPYIEGPTAFAWSYVGGAGWMLDSTTQADLQTAGMEPQRLMDFLI